MIVPTLEQPNIPEGPVNHNGVSFTLFQEILKHSCSRAKLHRYWEVITTEVRLQQDLDDQRRQAINEP
jgi:hypothetical protein